MKSNPRDKMAFSVRIHTAGIAQKPGPSGEFQRKGNVMDIDLEKMSEAKLIDLNGRERSWGGPSRGNLCVCPNPTLNPQPSNIPGNGSGANTQFRRY
jgi:hypothetical protein